ncbi:MAG: cobalamin-dependent protein [Candidatus Omnitrophota bacterium]
MSVDVVLVNPNDKERTYGSLAGEFTSIEPPLWLALLAAYLRERGFSVAIIDADALGIGPDEVAHRITALDPLLCGLGAVGTNPSASSTPKMAAVRAVLARLSGVARKFKTVAFGIHPSALPEQTLREEKVDFVCRGETFLCITALADALKNKKGGIESIKGLWSLQNGAVVANGWAEMLEDIDALPFAAWDLLPMDKYRAHNWHAFGHLEDRSSYVMVYTSLGCPHNCSYCNIHALYGENSGIRFRSTEKVLAEIDFLVSKYQVKNFKFLDELFVVNQTRMNEICDGLAARHYDINIWVYARIDTVTEDILRKLARAGVNWIAYGIEAASTNVRKGVSKGRFNIDEIKKTVALTHDLGIYVMGNYMFGLPDDDLSTMQETLDLAKELNCEYANFYTTMAYPGSKLYEVALKSGMVLPASWSAYSQFSPDTTPLATHHLTPTEVLRFRDKAFYEYFSSLSYQEMIRRKFGPETLAHVKRLLDYKIDRKLLRS